ncbi:MAG TPA: aminotransferase class V-fold PLP-dependent enzyme [Povalibacter sp.]|uniref:cysteine desulfurase family protein n=1 Tax=Povalibacter sp. TaxID=1962978 RepID=UPI002BEE1981|nr:aminotransferase class V-fold PLP-dependent enzyme [Povalibacter sp.]HMN43204.1 aminotransferase class V-fold PLP-dependent enzyme [Povalibacter sp.]
MLELPIYLDNAATTPVDPRVVDGMIDCLRNVQGNPSSMSHDFGRRARALVERARAQVATAIGARPECIVWTSGATESDNFAIMGAARFHADRGRHIVSAKTEHKAVLDALKQLEREGFAVTYLKPDAGGIVKAEQVAEALRPDTVLVSIMHVNNETGVINDVAAIGRLCRERGVLFHCDAAQSVGKVPVDVTTLNVDLLSLNAHKVHGPKGVGALYVRRTPPLGLRPLLVGGGQEGGLRSGTLATHQIVGMGLTFSLATNEMDRDMARMRAQRDRLWQGIAAVGEVDVNGDVERRAANILNVTFRGVEGESLQFALRRLAVSAGAACSSASEEASYVLRALGRTDQEAQSSLRFSLGRFTTDADIDTAIAEVQREVPRLRQIARRA